jgi:cobaltochelatase CobN
MTASATRAAAHACASTRRRAASSSSPSAYLTTRFPATFAAAARVFGPAPGDYGGGIANLVKQSRDAGNPELIAQAYLNHNNFAYSSDGWGESVPQALATQLKGNEVVIHSRTTNLYGTIDNDDFFDFAGGLNLATRQVNGGKAPEFYVANLRKAGRERRRRAGLHPDRGRCDQKLHCTQGRRTAGGRQELRTLDRVRQAAAAAFARRHRQQRLHRPSHTRRL